VSGSDQSSWLLIATVNEHGEPEVVGSETRPYSFVPVHKHFKRRGSLRELNATVKRLRLKPQPFDIKLEDRRVAAVPLIVEDRLHGFWFWSALSEVPMHTPPPAGAWVIDLTTYTALGSSEWAEMADIPEDMRGQERHVGAMFAQVDTSKGKEPQALSLIEGKPVGAPFQAEWIVSRRDESRWRAQFHLRIQEVERNGGLHRVALGVSHNIGELDGLRGRKKLADLNNRVLRASREPGEYVALMSAKTSQLIRWLTDPSPEIAWLGVEDEPQPAIHPDDLPEARRILHVDTEAEGGIGRGEVRVRGVDGAWIPIRVIAERVEMEDEEEAVSARVFVPESGLR
jgi:hypothetical protein